MFDLSLLVCSVIKNVENKLDENIQRVHQLGTHFTDYKIVIYENNSTDGTKNILESYRSNPHMTVISEDIPDYFIEENNVVWTYKEVTGSDHHCRMEHISNARNKLLREIRKSKYKSFSYVMMIDLDAHYWDINGVLDSFSKKDQWDGVVANSTGDATSFGYYDYFCLRRTNQPFGPDMLGEHFWEKTHNSKFVITSDDLIPVYSGFNGIGIYKKEILDKYNYDFLVNEEVKQFYETYLKTHDVPDYLRSIISKPCNPFKYGHMDRGIFWKSNSGYKGEIICEHVPLHLAMYNHNYRLVVNPRMIFNVR